MNLKLDLTSSCIYIAIIIIFLVEFYSCSYTSSNLAVRKRKSHDWMEKTLIKDLLRDYDRRARPTVDNKTFVYHVKSKKTNQEAYIQQLTVEFGLSLIQIMELDEMQQILTSNVRTLYRWKDYHLVWNPLKYDNITHVHVPTKEIWLPDISIYNYADERMEERRECNAVVKHDGTVEWHPMAIFKSTCPVRIKYFPFDQQCCKLKFGPWTYDGFRVNITFYDNKTFLDKTNFQPNAEWALRDSKARFNKKEYGCCPEPYPDISFHILIERNSAFYNYILILPCFLLSSLTLVLFWLPAESPAKMVLGMNIFIAFFLLVVLLEKSIPSASNAFPLIGKYYCVNMTLITLSTFLCLIIVNFHFRGDNRVEVPHWLKQLTIKHGARILMVDLGPLLKKPFKANITPPKPSTTPNSISNAIQTPTPALNQPPLPLSSSSSSGLPLPTNQQLQHHHHHHHHHRHQQQQQQQPNHHHHSAPPPPAQTTTTILPSNHSGYFSNYGTDDCCQGGHHYRSNSRGYNQPPLPDTMCYSGDENFSHQQPSDPPSSCQFTMNNALTQQHPQQPSRYYSHQYPSAGGGHTNYCVGGSRDCTPDRIIPPPTSGSGPGSQHYMHSAPPISMETPFVFDRYPRLEPHNNNMTSSSGPDDDEDDARCMVNVDDDEDDDDDAEIEHDLNYRGQQPYSGGNFRSVSQSKRKTSYFREYEEDLKEFLFECVQSPQPTTNPLAASWASYNSAALNASCSVPHAGTPGPGLPGDPVNTKQQQPIVFNCRTPPIQTSNRNSRSLSRQLTNNNNNNNNNIIQSQINEPTPTPSIFVTRRVNMITKDINDLIKDLAYIQKNNENRERVNRIVSEWRAVGMVLDRFFFILYVIAIILSLILFFPKAGNVNYFNENNEVDCNNLNKNSE